ncbi:MAG: response regulator [Paenibacillaceae bacterium]|nr:response regulator [Paenibacillaceae bacterium]
MRKKSVLLAASVIITVVMPLLWLANSWRQDRHNPQAVGGHLDLSGWSFTEDGTVQLSGEWEFYRGKLLTPEDFAAGTLTDRPLLVKPGAWNAFIAEDGGKTGMGYATYRMRIKLNDSSVTYFAVRTTNIRTSNRIFMNGVEIGAAGNPAGTKDDVIPSNTPYLGIVPTAGNEADIIVQVANYHYESGGIIYPIVFGDRQSVMESRDHALFADFTATASFLIPAAFFLLLYFLRRQERSLLHLGLLCLSAVGYVLTHGEKLLDAALPGLGYEWFTKLQFIFSFITYYFMIRYVDASAPGFVRRRVVVAAGAIMLVQLAIALLFPVQVYSRLLGLVILYAFAVTGYVAYVMLMWLRRHRKDGLPILLGIESLSAIIALHSLYAIGLLNDYISLTFELLVFVLAQTTLFVRRFARSFREVELLSTRLLTLDGLKDEFMAHTSHELRTPLHGIINIAESLQEGAAGQLNAEQMRNMRMISATGRRLSALVNDILDFSKLKSADVRLNRKAVHLPAVAQSVIEVIRHTTGKKELAIVQRWPERLPLLDTDEDRLSQMLFNLLGNAVKYTDRGEIALSATVEGDWIAVSVADTGIGIAEERLEAIFASYEQLDAWDDRERPGTGLGLSITRKLVELHGGSIKAESEPGRGSTFTFTLPAAKDQSPLATHEAAARVAAAALAETAAALAEPAPAAVATGGASVLIVDDDPVNLQVLINLLAPERYKIVTAVNGEEALRELQHGPQPDLVITDWMMPGMSGLELCGRIRERYLLSELPVLMLTARSRPEDIRGCFAAGVNDYLGKPVHAEELRARVRTLLQLRTSIEHAIRTEIAFLQAQIKPHFLFNSLNTIIANCQVNPNQATVLLLKLSDYLRSSFDFQNRDRLVSLRKELALVEAYLQLEKARFDERLNVEYEIEASLDTPIPPLSIQPIIENAVRHGIMIKPDGGTIRLSVAAEDDCLAVCVADDGVGMTAERVREALGDDRSDKGIGLHNIHKRLLTLFGAGLAIDSAPDAGTKVAFRVPKGEGRRADRIQ